MLEDQKTSVGWMRQEVGRLEAELQGVHAENAYLNRFEATPHPQRSPPSPLRRRTPKGSPWLPPPSAAYAPARRLRLLRGSVEERGEVSSREGTEERLATQGSSPPSALPEEGRRHGVPAHCLGCWARRPDRRRFHRVLTVQCTFSPAKGRADL